MANRRPREADTAKTRQQIIAATNLLISKKGLSATSVSAVARVLGMSHANVYRHFKSRDDLLIAVAETWMSETRAACEKAYDSNATVADNLEALVCAIRTELLRRADNMAALELYHFALEHMPDSALAHHKHRASLVAKIIGASKPAAPVLNALRGFTDPVLLLATESEDITNQIGDLCRLLETGLQKTHDTATV